MRLEHFGPPNHNENEGFGTKIPEPFVFHIQHSSSIS